MNFGLLLPAVLTSTFREKVLVLHWQWLSFWLVHYSDEEVALVKQFEVGSLICFDDERATIASGMTE